MISRNLAPGRFRKFAAEYWPCVDGKNWRRAREEADDLAVRGGHRGANGIRGHGGTIRVDSEPGSGTSFKILFPASGTLADAPRRREATDAAWRGKGTILVADDEEMVRTLATNVLEKAGFERDVARQELLKVLNGVDSQLLRAVGIQLPESWPADDAPASESTLATQEAKAARAAI